MGSGREKPSTKARKQGYRKLHNLERLLIKLLYPKVLHQESEVDGEHWLKLEFLKVGWRDYMIRHTPALKRGGPAIAVLSKRRKSKLADRQSTVR